MKTIKITLSPDGVDRAKKELEKYQKEIQAKVKTLCIRLAEVGEATASLYYDIALYDGVKDIVVTSEPTENGCKVLANGHAVAFVEFGSGILYGHGHPLESELGMGAGTYPGKGNWDNPNGWYYEKHEHTYGNPPSQAMYYASQEMLHRCEEIAREVFA